MKSLSPIIRALFAGLSVWQFCSGFLLFSLAASSTGCGSLEERRQRQQAAAKPDVLLDVNRLHVDRAAVRVEDLDAHLELNADIAGVAVLHAGLDASAGLIDIQLDGVDADAALEVRLDEVQQIVESALQTVEGAVQPAVRGGGSALPVP